MPDLKKPEDVDLSRLLERIRDKAINDIHLFDQGLIWDGDSTQVLAWYINEIAVSTKEG